VSEQRLGKNSDNSQGSSARITEHGRRIRIARQAREYDDQNFPTPVYDPYGSRSSPDDITTE
jgi:hypothetical protein